MSVENHAAAQPTRVKPKKALGQHFLTDANLARKIVALAMPREGELLLEIGPGMGILTQWFPQQYPENTYQAVEVDAEAALYLRQRFSGLNLLQQDILRFHPEAGSWVVTGNLPYQISSPIAFWFLQHRTYFRRGVWMLQHEVAQRMAAPHGSKTYGILSVLLALYYEVEYQFKVAPGAFHPPPKVQSGVITLERKAAFPDISFSLLLRVVKTAFGQRRKTLRNALSSLPLTLDPLTASMRAEQLPPEAFVGLAAQLSEP